MNEVIQSIEVIETETGYRIEIKGNKEFIKQWVQRFQPGQRPEGQGQEWQGGWGHGHGHHGFGHGPGFGRGFGFRRRHGWRAPWMYR